jgi:hypothetical protein
MRTTLFTALLLATPALAGAKVAATKLTVTSSAFSANGAIPDEYTCAGSSVSPQLAWSNTPASAKSVAILVEDPDAPKGTVVHWLVTGIDPAMSAISRATVPDGAMQAKNEKGALGYMGPCPPAGAPHHYHFHVYALDTTPARAANKADFMTQIKGHVVAEGELVGTYQKK